MILDKLVSKLSRFIPALALSSLISFNQGCYQLPQPNIPITSQQTKKEKPLYVNTKKEHYSLAKSRKSGERDLAKLCKTSKIEEGFMFVEYENGENIWYENGVEEKTGSCSFNLYEMNKIIREGKPIKKISFYHFHPDETKHPKTISETPSSLDINASILISMILEPNYPELVGKIDSKIVVTSGVYTIKINPFIEEQKLINYVSKISYNVIIERAKIASGRSDLDYSQNNRANFTSLNQKFAQKFNNPAVDFKFQQFKY